MFGVGDENWNKPNFLSYIKNNMEKQQKITYSLLHEILALKVNWELTKIIYQD